MTRHEYHDLSLGWRILESGERAKPQHWETLLAVARDSEVFSNDRQGAYFALVGAGKEGLWEDALLDLERECDDQVSAAIAQVVVSLAKSPERRERVVELCKNPSIGDCRLILLDAIRGVDVQWRRRSLLSLSEDPVLSHEVNRRLRRMASRR